MLFTPTSVTSSWIHPSQLDQCSTFFKPVLASMSVIKRSACNYDTWSELVWGKSNKQKFRIWNRGPDVIDVLLFEFEPEMASSTEVTSNSEMKVDLHLFADCRIRPGLKTDISIPSQHIIAYFIVKSEIAQTLCFDVKSHRGYVYGTPVDDATYGFCESQVKLKPLPKVSFKIKIHVSTKLTLNHLNCYTLQCFHFVD